MQTRRVAKFHPGPLAGLVLWGPFRPLAGEEALEAPEPLILAAIHHPLSAPVSKKP